MNHDPRRRVPDNGRTSTSARGHSAAGIPRLRRLTAMLAMLAVCPHVLAGDMIASKVKIRAVADNITVETLPGKTTKTSLSIFSRKKTEEAHVGSLDVGVVDVGEQAHVTGVNIDMNVQASNIYVKGASARIASMYFR